MISAKWRGQRRLNGQSKTDENGILLTLGLPDIIKKCYLKYFPCCNKY